jgi:hypothetical protein
MLTKQWLCPTPEGEGAQFRTARLIIVEPLSDARNHQRRFRFIARTVPFSIVFCVFVLGWVSRERR